jgi:hypothetical protein
VLSLCTLPYASFDALVADATINSPRARVELSHGWHSGLLLREPGSDKNTRWPPFIT